MFNKHRVGYQKYDVDDDSYQDIYDQTDRKRGKPEKPSSKAINYWLPVVVFFIILAIFLSFAGMLYPFYEGIVRAVTKGSMLTMSNKLTWFDCVKIVARTKLTLIVTVIDFFICLYMVSVMKQNWKLQNIKSDHTQLNTYHGDSRLQQPEELPRQYGIFPDRGAHSSVRVTAALGHMVLGNQGVENVKVTQFYDRDTYDDKTGIWHKKNEMMLDDSGYPVQKSLPVFDTADGHEMFDASGMESEKFKTAYHPNLLEYNPKGRLGRAKYKTVADMINNDWHMPYYEKQRPLGIYVVDSGPNNTEVLASTRAGKGQTIIEPTIDMWTRSDDGWSFLANDPKSELYRKFYYPASMRGYDVIAFNLMNESKTNIYNPLGYAIMAARQADSQKVTQFVSDITTVFFPVDGQEDKLWPMAASNAFREVAYGLLDFYNEEEASLLRKAHRYHWSPNKLARKIDVLWGHVTPYNIYQMMIQLASKRGTDEKFIYRGPDDDGKEPMDYLTSFFEATKALPKNSLRQATMDAYASLVSMAKSEKTIASVYGIAQTAMSFFADPKISRLTSGQPSQDFDMVGLGFPRRVEIHLDPTYMNENSMRDQAYRWEAYHDHNFTQKYEGEDFIHDGIVPASGWLMYVFKGLLTDNKDLKSYFKLTVTDIGSHQPMKVFYFEFKRTFERSLDGRSYIVHPVTKKRVIKNGILSELKYVRDKATGVGKMIYASTVIKRRHQFDLAGENEGTDQTIRIPAITQVDVHYTEKPKAMFLIAPPQMPEYANIGLIMLNQLFNMQVDKSYLLRANQKPFYGLREMLDEVGNLQSGGHGIAGLQTKESIGLGQDQQFTLILQTVQQLKDIYNESIDKILQANTGNIIYLKSTDNEMLETLQNMSGMRHEVQNKQFSIQRNAKAKINANDAKITDTSNLETVPVITKTNMLISPRNSTMVFGKGFPIYNRNQMINPMSWFLYNKQLVDPIVGEYRLETVPSTSNTNDFDRIANQPNFFAMLAKRVRQARLAKEMETKYRNYYGNASSKHAPFTDDDMSRIDVEELSAKIMEGIDMRMEEEDRRTLATAQEEKEVNDAAESGLDILDDEAMGEKAQAYVAQESAQEAVERGENNDEFMRESATRGSQQAESNKKIYANGQLSRRQLRSGLTGNGNPNHYYDAPLAEAYDLSIAAFTRDPNFTVTDHGSLVNAITGELLITNYNEGGAYQKEVDAIKKKIKTTVNSKLGSNDSTDLTGDLKYSITDAFYIRMTSIADWTGIANGKFDLEAGKAVQRFEHPKANDRSL